MYGVLLIVAAMLSGLAVTVWSDPPGAVTAVVLVADLIAWLTGLMMTLRDYSGPPRRR